MPGSTVSSVAERIRKLLPADGTPVLNRVLRIMLSRDTGQTIGDEVYDQARDKLFAAGQIGRLRGQGGQIFLAKGENGRSAAPSPVDTASKLTEIALMPHLDRYLNGAFRKELDIPAHGECVIKDTSRLGPPLARWSRPDFILVTAMRFKVMPGSQLDVYSFELKAEFGATDLAVYEALAQTRFTHFGYLVWHVPKNSAALARLPEITAQCTQHGVGLIHIHDPRSDEAFETVLDPVRKATPPAAVDSFLEQRLNDKEQARLRAALDGARSWEKIVDGMSATMRRLLAQTKTYDFILMDCAPGISVLTEVSIRLADLVIVPTIADFLSTYGLQAFCATLQKYGASEQFKRPKKLPRVLVTRRRPVIIHRDTAERLRLERHSERPHFRVFDTEIPEAVAVSNALSMGNVFPTYTAKWGDEIVSRMEALIDEIKEALDVHRA